MIGTNTFRRELPCILSREEKASYSDELARLTQEQAELKDRKKEITAEYKAKIDACTSQSRVIARKISTGKEMRDVECYWEFDYPRCVKSLIRADTFEPIETKTLTGEELQKQLNFEQEEAAETEADGAIDVVNIESDGGEEIAVFSREKLEEMGVEAAGYDGCILR
ncbi:MAG: hypothetical protein FD174_2600 [Geobacteraceae bacterium]|nr:MAG: hypothetical protein FD174_2600 [Geobacteraceae bacterium]